MMSRTFFVRSAIAGAVAMTLIAGGVVAQSANTQNPAEVQAGTYKLDPDHGKITWSIKHLGFSTYYGQFTNVSADLTIDPANPSAGTLTATVPLSGLAPNNDALKTHLLSADFFDAAQFPEATFKATSIVIDRADASEADVTGDLTLHGVTRPVVLEVKFNQGGPARGGGYKVGFDGETTIKRSDFGINTYLPALGDDVELHIEGEFNKQS